MPEKKPALFPKKGSRAGFLQETRSEKTTRRNAAGVLSDVVNCVCVCVCVCVARSGPEIIHSGHLLLQKKSVAFYHKHTPKD